MENRFAVKGSNTLFKVWGIIVWVFAGINGLLNIISFIAIMAGASIVSNPLGYYDYYSGSSTSGAMWILIIVGVILSILWIIFEIITGIVLVRDYVQSKGALIALAVIWFIRTLGALCIFVLGIAAGSAAFIIVGLLIAAWFVATGVILIIKQNRAIPRGGGYVSSVPRSKTYAMLEGAYGGFQGRQYRLEVGQTCKIGREATCDIQLYHPKISRLHCTVTLLANGNFSIIDYSSNGTFYGNMTLHNGVATEVRPGDMLVVGEADNVIALRTYSGSLY